MASSEVDARYGRLGDLHDANFLPNAIVANLLRQVKSQEERAMVAKRHTECVNGGPRACACA
jgi:hypothetical protein